ncbi:TetR family transcriptional regulator [Streptomyces sp. NPDC087850]|uniref:TetR family transcriptional regulator n=1 Tax=Streptomyces sp. NPDC087850 TaxID=3365809 RepID=UPI003828C92F
MSHTRGIRQAQKQKTRRALLDAALRLLADQGLSSLGLREVTRAVGVTPTAFYRHFRDTADLGTALVEEALGSLHGMIGGTFEEAAHSDERIDRAVEVIRRQVRAYPAHVRFVSRERHGGVRQVREAIAAQLRRFSTEVATALGAQPASAGWSGDDLRMLADVYVDHLVMTASAFLDAAEEGPDAEERVAFTARRQLRLIALGRRHWLD